MLQELPTYRNAKDAVQGRKAAGTDQRPLQSPGLATIKDYIPSGRVLAGERRGLAACVLRPKAFKVLCQVLEDL